LKLLLAAAELLWWQHQMLLVTKRQRNFKKCNGSIYICCMAGVAKWQHQICKLCKVLIVPPKNKKQATCKGTVGPESMHQTS